MTVANDVITEAVLRAKNVNVYYGSHLAVKEVSIDIPERQVVAFIGHRAVEKAPCYAVLIE